LEAASKVSGDNGFDKSGLPSLPQTHPPPQSTDALSGLIIILISKHLESLAPSFKIYTGN
jgi:hypothetical protein